MGHTVDYSNLSKVEAYEKALKDSKFWLGPKAYKKVIGILEKDAQEAAEKGTTITLEQLSFNLAFVGIKGFPVQAFYWKCILPYTAPELN
jgi:hypothetical protein